LKFLNKVAIPEFNFNSLSPVGSKILIEENRTHANRGSFKEKKMKIIAAIVLFFAGLTQAHAAGAYDGIYQNGNVYLSVHQNGGIVIITRYVTIPTSGVTVSTSLGTVTPTTLNTWDLFNGPISGNSANVSGLFVYNGCNISLNVTFGDTGLTSSLSAASQTASGAIAGLKCAAFVGVNSVFTKAF